MSPGLLVLKRPKNDPNSYGRFGFWKSHGVYLKRPRVHWHCSLSVVELRGDPGQSPLQISEHELERFGPLLLRVELGFDGVRATAAAGVLDLPFLHIHPDVWNTGQVPCICLHWTEQLEITCMGGRIQCLLSPPPLWTVGRSPERPPWRGRIYCPRRTSGLLNSTEAVPEQIQERSGETFTNRLNLWTICNISW